MRESRRPIGDECIRNGTVSSVSRRVPARRAAAPVTGARAIRRRDEEPMIPDDGGILGGPRDAGADS